MIKIFISADAKVESSSLSRKSLSSSFSLSFSSFLAQSESNRSYPPTIHSFTPRPEIYERVVATPLIIALAFVLVYSKKKSAHLHGGVLIYGLVSYHF